MIRTRHRPTPWIYRWSRPLMGAIATAGALTTGYLTASKLLNHATACPIKGCEQVLNGQYATVLGAPLSLWGCLAYITMAVLALGPLLLRLGKRQQQDNLEQWTALLLFAGATAMVIFSGYLMYLLAFQIHALCPYCIVSALFSLSLFILAAIGRDWLDRGQLIFIGIVVAIVTLVGTLWIYSPINATAKSPEIDQPVSSDFLNSLKQASQQGLTSTTAKSDQLLLRAIPPGASTPNPPGKLPEVVYIGADYCPFCASLRWSLTLALLRFGEFDGLKYMRSSPIDNFPDTPTLSFYQSSYKSSYLTFTPVELQDREGQPLQKPTPAQESLLEKFDVPPYTISPGGIPFIYIGGRYIQSGTPVSPELLHGLSWQQVKEQLQTSNSSIAQPLLSNANLLTVAFCQLTKQAPSNVCKAPGVTAAAAAASTVLK
ncbi:MAG: DUF929 family protein [Chroococcidiopsidaceae cyanobacterium CP_BM_RX_35]|nr:DUF929 family protein [Chroococcidiopsidaceae cyanobacterium CP_BM_RX_35]